MASQVETENGPSLTSLVSGIIHDGQELIREQLHLFQVEVKHDLKRTSQASVFLIIGGMVAGMGVLLLSTMAALLLHEMWPASISLWGGFGIVAGVLLVVGIAFLFYGKSQFDAFSPLPDKSVEGLKETVQWKTKT
jgi:hypothetical protein